MKRIWFIAVLVIAAIGILAASFLGNSEAQESPSPEGFVREYLELVKARDYENIVDLMIDDRFNNDRQTKIDNYKMFEGDSNDFKKYEIKEVKDVTEDKATVVAVVEFKDGSIEQIPMHLVKKEGNWKLHIDTGDAFDDEDFKIIKKPDITQNEQSSSPEEFATEYLESHKAKKYERMAEMVIDERFPDLKERVTMYKESDKHTALEEYEIKEVKDVTEETATVVVELTRKYGEVLQVPLHLVKKSGEWKVYISSEDINKDEDFKMIKPATEF
ncbi:DUF4878 domain-containing protein [Domibacillus sp. PGB-M46]|uniref:DUF4878 domain-containing protein n=1 Tax=Domibacillus sp. PGB-M46 TaxID=2910255 RepID=UPI001F57244A|nr:DUF4878 domain-containing protein [Domibacillus sp. PGB-M46]MCI2256180.1 DUF4878 domain-containing protein [Domibacillus sp. PGB-M46]